MIVFTVFVLIFVSAVSLLVMSQMSWYKNSPELARLQNCPKHQQAKKDVLKGANAISSLAHSVAFFGSGAIIGGALAMSNFRTRTLFGRGYRSYAG